MPKPMNRIAINFGGGYVPGLDAVITGAVLAADKLGWEVVGIRDGFQGLLFPDRYPDGGLVKLTPALVENIAGATGWLLGTVAQSDPFHIRTLNSEEQIEERDRSGELLETIRKERIDAVISVAGSRALSILWKLSQKGLTTVCVPKSVENDVPGTALSFGFNSALSFVAEMLERCRQAALSTHKIGVVEVLGEHAGWLALQSGMAVRADAVLIPEIPYDLHRVAAKLGEKLKAGRRSGLIVVAEGAKALSSLVAPAPGLRALEPQIKASLSPGALGGDSLFVIEQTGRIAEQVALEIQRLTDHETYPLVLGALAQGGTPTVVDRQLGLGYGVGAVRALSNKQAGVMVVYQPPDLNFVPLAEAINKVRTVPPESEFVHIARALDISLGN